MNPGLPLAGPVTSVPSFSRKSPSCLPLSPLAYHRTRYYDASFASRLALDHPLKTIVLVVSVIISGLLAATPRNNTVALLAIDGIVVLPA